MRSILLVEHAVSQAAWVKDGLRRGSEIWCVHHVMRLDDALETLARTSFDLVLIDLELRGVSPGEALRRVVEAAGTAPVLVLGDPEGGLDPYAAIAAGAWDWLAPDTVSTPRHLERALLVPAMQTRAGELAARLVHADRLSSVGVLASGLAHEVNNPAAYALLGISYIDRRLRELEEELAGDDSAVARRACSVSEELREVAKDCRMGMDTITRIVRDVSSFSRAGTAPELGEVDLNEVVHAATNLAWNSVRYRAHVKKDLGPLPLLVGDRGRLCQLVVNLLVNAAQAVPERQDTPGRIEVTTRHEAGRIVLSISDTGSAGDEATGLGLTVCAGIVAEHSGHIRRDSAPGLGSSVTIELPLDNGLTLPEALVSFSGRPRGEGFRVLLIDDEELVCRALARSLRCFGHEVTWASSLARAKEVLEGVEVDVIVCDVMMPGGDGQDVYDHVRAVRPELADHIVFITGGAFEPRLSRFLDGVDNLVIEKVAPAPLLDQVLTTMARTWALSERARQPVSQDPRTYV